MKRFIPLLLILALLPFSGCESTQIAKSVAMHMFGKREVSGHYKVGTPYRVGGTWYYPKEDPGYSETGMASWYGSEFHGKATANGEVFNRHDLTAAHRTLPLPSMVRVTNLDNGKTILVRVNDRGPYSKNRILDVSEDAAKELGFHNKGTTRVKVNFDQAATTAMLDREGHKKYARAGSIKKKSSVQTMQLASKAESTMAKMPPASPTAATEEWHEAKQPRPIPGDSLYVQMGSFSSKSNAGNVAQTLHKMAKVRIQEVAFPERVLYRVRLGPLNDEKEADKLLGRVEGMGFRDAIIVKD